MTVPTIRPQTRSELRAGPLTMVFEGGDLLFVRVGDHEIARRIFAAVRDRNWGTPAGSISNVQIQPTADSFRVTYLCRVVEDEIDFEWEAEILGESSGSVTFRIEGLARSTFLRNRIGLNVLHPVDEWAGQTCRTRRVSGAVVKTRFPEEIADKDVLEGFEEMCGMSCDVAEGVIAEFEFSGDLFETEDQRNWTDATYKTFSTPLNLTFPVEVPAGSRLSQMVRLRVKTSKPVAIRTRHRPLAFTLTQDPPQPLPAIGLGTASHRQPLSGREVAWLRALRLSHLRVDVSLEGADPMLVLASGRHDAHALCVPLELAISHSGALNSDVLLRAFEPLRDEVASCIIFPCALASVVRSRFPLWQIGSGSAADFYYLNQNPPRTGELDFLVYAIHPQEHSFDDRSLVETLPIQASTVARARRLGGGCPVHVSPVSLKPRFRAAATGPEPATAPGKLPPQVDIRQASLFGAGWTVISLKYLAEAGAASVTFYETSGWRGVVETDAGSPAPFPSLPGAVFPLYHVFGDFAEFRGGDILPSKSTDPLVVDGLVLEKHGRRRIIMVNFTSLEQEVAMDTAGRPGCVRLLDEASVPFAMENPVEYRMTRGADSAQLVLPRFAVATIDYEE